jgi:hypothetical protein
MTRALRGGLAALVLSVPAADPGVTGQTPERVDYLTFAQGAVPLRVGGSAATLGANFERALQVWCRRDAAHRDQ